MIDAANHKKKLPGNGQKIKVALTTLGCKVNQCDSAAMADQLKAADFELIPFSAPADAYIINTCTVTAIADFQARQLIRRAFRQNPSACIVVTGCYAQTQSSSLAGMEGVTLVVDNEQKYQISKILYDIMNIESSPRTQKAVWKEQLISTPSRLSGRTRAFFKVQDGCNAFCSYCIVPFARGRSRSLPASRLLEGIHQFVAQDYREIVLTGIHLGDYGRDLQPRTNLAKTLALFLPKYADVRFRLSSIEPKEITEELLELFLLYDNLCPHLHIPLQSGDDTILRAMKRGYDGSFYRMLIEKAVKSIAHIAVGVDVMTGFPGEGEQEFHNTMELLTNLPIAYLHVFPYSERPGTEALNLHPKVSEKVKKERATILRELGKRKKETFSRRFLGQILPVLVEHSKDKKTGLWKGISHNYLSVLLQQASCASVNQLVNVRIEQYQENRLRGNVDHEK
ncbi:MAG: tRNA (N(6)-L-threonylcarbamoyladenosine(37)-C(2))-methylthiotransferase MtaB [Syntrophaceae bacterium]|jgi:threonylcarbamoyladenosine tRNA methylthiotransferase MtaB|nr:tRNA (N(6)-L-threonylcarbamoyladenosine(37)-C(2))-methylthiotransferase MtaB [Syntrophaceae bacterium]